jgi:hypothetical protein
MEFVDWVNFLETLMGEGIEVDYLRKILIESYKFCIDYRVSLGAKCLYIESSIRIIYNL